MPQYNYETGQMEETEEERRAREEAEKRAGTTVVGETKRKQYEDGSQTETVTKEIPAPSFGDRLGQAFTRAGENFVNNVTSAPDRFVNNLNRGIDNVRNAPDRFMQNVSGAPGQMQQRVAAPVAPSGFQGQTDEFGGVDQAIARQAQQPAPVAPVAPGSTFDRMIQAESGGRQTNAQGQVLTSNKGAMGIAQVMPTTAMDPGYGVKNIFDLAQERGIPFQNRDRATAEQLLGNRALNQEFGANYYKAMENRFDGGPGAVAAYNAGPGRVSQNMAQNQGQLNVAQLPQETQGYLQKVGMPTPAQRPPQPVSPEQLAQQPMPANQGINPQRPGLNIPGLTPVAQMPPPVDTTAQAISRYQAIQDKPDELMKFAFDANTPDYLKQRAQDQLVQSYDSQKKESEATKVIPSMNQNEIARAMTKKSEGNSVGDWVQYLLFKHVGLTDLANQKGEQLGIGHKWASAMDAEGNTGMVQYTASGLPLTGVKSDGSDMSKSELAAYSSQGAGKTSDVSLTMHQAQVDGKIHTFESKRTPAGLLYRDATANGTWKRQAPEGMTNVGQQDPAHLKGLSTMKSVMEKYRKDSLSASQSTGRPLYTEEQIQAAGNQAYQGITGKPFAGMAGAAGTAAATTETAPAGAAANTAKPEAAKGAKSLAQQILDYEAPSPPASARDAGSVALRNEVNRLAGEQGRVFNSGNFKLAAGFNNSQSGKALKSINVAVDHLDTLQEAANELKNGQTPAFNKIANLYATNTGQTAPGNFDALKSIVGSEVAKAVVGGASALGDREEIRKEIANSKTPEQLAGIIGRLQALMAGQAKGIRQEWISSGLDEATFDNKLMPRTKVVLNKQKEPTRSKW